MRVRIRKAVMGFAEDASLSHLTPGKIYELNTALAHYLITVGAADAVGSVDDAARSPEHQRRGHGDVPD